MKAGWKTVKLGEVCSFERGLTYSKSDEAEAPGITVLRANNVDLDSGRLNLDDLRYISAKVAVDEKKYLSANSIIVCTASGSRDHLGKTAHISKPPRMTFGGFMGLLKPSPEIDSLFLFYLTRSDLYRSFIAGLSSGTNINNLKGSDLLSWEIPLPPLAEQKRIVAMLDEAFAGIDEATAKAEANIRDAEILFESYLQSVFHDQEQGWEQKRLGDLVTRLTNGYVGPTRNIYQESGVPYLLARHVKNNRLNFDGRTFISQEFNLKNKKSLLKTGDVLLVQSGHIGHCAVVTDEHDGHNCHAMIVITATKGSFIGPFLSLFFNSSGMKRKFEQIRSGSTVPHLTCGEIRELMIPLPTIEIQKDIVERAKVLDEYILQLRSNLANRLSAYDEFKRSLLIQAFAGELTA